MDTKPTVEQTQDNAAAHLVIKPSVIDDKTGSMWVHKDYVKVRDPWENEGHIAPISLTEKFGDVESWVKYVQKFGSNKFLTWNAHGLWAVLDYHQDQQPGRCTWRAQQPFIFSKEWTDWMTFANGSATAQRKAIEFLEDHAQDIVDPDAADLMDILRNLRANVSAEARTELKPDGGTSVAFSQEKTIRGAANSVELPTEIRIGIPVLKGHVDADDKPVKYEMPVRIRASVDDDAHLNLRFSIQVADRVQEEVFAEQVKKAQDALGTEYSILRAV